MGYGMMTKRGMARDSLGYNQFERNFRAINR